MKKMPSSSWMERRNMVIVFVSENNSYPRMAEISKILYFLELEIRHTWPANFGIEGYL